MEISYLLRLFLLYDLLFFQYFHENSWKFGMELEMKLPKKNFHGIRRKVHEIS